MVKKKDEVKDPWQPAKGRYADTFNFEDEGQELIGILLEKRGKVGQYDSNAFIVEVKGEQLTVWGSDNLDPQLMSIPEGSEIKIIYDGKGKNERTGRTFKKFRVFFKPPGPAQPEKDDDIPF